MRSDFARLAAAFFLLPASTAMAAAPEPQQADAPTPPPLKTTGLVPVDVQGSNLRFGVDPQSITIDGDTVRLVVVATSASGAVNAMYEGIRCKDADVRIYARHFPGTGWTTVKEDWRSLYDDVATRHSLAIARGGACMEKMPNRAREQIVRDLAAPAGMKYEEPPR